VKMLAPIAVATLSVGLSSLARAQTAALSCAGDEASALRQAPLGAARVSPQRLTVTWASGSTIFADSGTEEGSLDGTAYRYCGFNPTVGMHLIHKAADGVFTGVLLDDATGRILPAGQEVLFAPDRTKYFATVQPDGLDGQEWYLYARDGSLIWRGESGITDHHPSAKYDYFIATLDQPRWSNAGALQSTLLCAIGPPGRSATVTLTRGKSGWRWLPHVVCARAR